MDIHSAEAHMEKVLQYLEQMHDNNSSLYSKTREKLKNISNDLFKGLKLVSEILEEDSLVVEAEFGGTDESIISSVKSMKEQSEEISQVIDRVDSFVYSPPPEPKLTYSTNKLSAKKRRHIVYTYGQVLKKVAGVSTPYKSVRDCAALIWRWYDTRFFLSLQSCSKFHYNIRNIPECIKWIVLAYSKHLSDHTLDSFFSDFDIWLSSLVSPNAGNNYLLPYEIFKIGRETTISDISQASIMIWDILFDLGYSELSKDDLADVKLQSETIYNLAVKIAPDIADNYVYYEEDDSLLRSLEVS